MNHSHDDHAHRCQEFLVRLSMYLDDELAASDRRSIEHHLRDCPCCEEVLESLRHTVNLCHEEGKPELPDQLRVRARARVEELLQQARAPKSRSRRS